MTGKTWSRAALVLALGGLLAGTAAAATVKAEVEPRSVSMDGTLILRVVVSGENLSTVLPPATSGVTDWSVVNGPSVSTQFSYVNGVSSSQRTFTWILAPTGTGRKSIPPLEVKVDGQKLLTDVIEVRVRPATDPRVTPPETSQEDSSRDLFIRAVVEPEDPFVGQQVTLDYLLFTRAEVASIPQMQDVPTYPNFWTEEIETPQRATARRERIDGRDYRVYSIRKVALFPTASGVTELEPITFSIPVKVRRSGVRRSFFFDPVETIYRRTLPVTIRVRPLPAQGRPEDFSNAVGQFTLDVRTDADETVETGQAVSLTVSVEGEGNLRSVAAPALAPNAEFTVYPPQQQEGATSLGERSWEYILVPRRPGRQELPGVRFSYFDPVEEAYRTLESPLQVVQVLGQAMAEGEEPSLREQQEIQRLGSDIHHIKTPPVVPRQAALPLYRTAWFWLFIATPPLANLSLVALRWRSRRASRMEGVSRRRRASAAAVRRLKRAAASAETPDGNDLFRSVALALTGFIADKFGGQASGLTYDRIAQLLAAHDIPDVESRNFLAVLEECDCARFAPEASGADARRQLVERARKVLADLEAHL